MSLPCVASVFLCKPPVHRFACAMACVSPRQHFPASGVESRDTSIKTRLGKRRELDVSHIEPRPFEGCVVRSNPLRQLERLIRRENLIESTRRVRVQIVLHKTNRLSMRVMKFAQRVHKFSVINRCSSCSHFNITTAYMRFKRYKHTKSTIF